MEAPTPTFGRILQRLSQPYLVMPVIAATRCSNHDGAHLAAAYRLESNAMGVAAEALKRARQLHLRLREN